MLGSDMKPKTCGNCYVQAEAQVQHCDSIYCYWWRCEFCGYTNNDKGRAIKFARGI